MATGERQRRENQGAKSAEWGGTVFAQLASKSVASLMLVSPGAATDECHPIFS